LIYVVFALLAGGIRECVIELAGVVAFGIIAFLGVRRSVLYLAFGWLAHVAWDLSLHPHRQAAYAPSWYPMVCLGFDVLVAGAILRLNNQSSAGGRLPK